MRCACTNGVHIGMGLHISIFLGRVSHFLCNLVQRARTKTKKQLITDISKLPKYVVQVAYATAMKHRGAQIGGNPNDEVPEQPYMIITLGPTGAGKSKQCPRPKHIKKL